MSSVFDCRDEAQLLPGMRQARQAIGRGELVVIPTDTVYGVAADAFSARAVQRLLDAKGRGRQSPPPVLVAGLTTLRALVAEVPEPVERLVEAFWPGGLTIVLPVAAVAVVGPRRDARHGGGADARPPHRARAARGDRPARRLERQPHRPAGGRPRRGRARACCGDSVAVYLDGGPSQTGVASTIVDATSLVGGADPRVRVLREGAIDRARLREVLGDLLEDDPDDTVADPAPAAESTADIPDAEPQPGGGGA